MLPSRTLEKSLQQINPDLRDIVLELRNIIVRVAPGVSEVGTVRGYNYFYKDRGGPVSAGVCQIGLHRDHVRLAFIHGAFLPDPKNLLQGESLYKRYVRLELYDTVPWEDLKDLILHSSRFDPRTLDFH